MSDIIGTIGFCGSIIFITIALAVMGKHESIAAAKKYFITATIFIVMSIWGISSSIGGFFGIIGFLGSIIFTAIALVVSFKKHSIVEAKKYWFAFVIFVVMFISGISNSGISNSDISNSDISRDINSDNNSQRENLSNSSKKENTQTQPSQQVLQVAPKYIIGASKEQITNMFSGWEYKPAYEKNVDPNAIKFENSNLLVVIDFDKNSIAEGVSFLSLSPLGDPITGKGSYVDTHYNELVQWATGGKNLKVDKDVTQYPCEIYIGNYHKF